MKTNSSVTQFSSLLKCLFGAVSTWKWRLTEKKGSCHFLRLKNKNKNKKTLAAEDTKYKSDVPGDVFQNRGGKRQPRSQDKGGSRELPGKGRGQVPRCGRAGPVCERWGQATRGRALKGQSATYLPVCARAACGRYTLQVFCFRWQRALWADWWLRWPAPHRGSAHMVGILRRSLRAPPGFQPGGPRGRSQRPPARREPASPRGAWLAPTLPPSHHSRVSWAQTLFPSVGNTRLLFATTRCRPCHLASDTEG